MAVMRLEDRAVLRVSGEDAGPFLQGLLTADIPSLTAGTARPAALLTPQGKVLFDMLIVPTGDAILLDCRSHAREALATRLSFYRLRAKVEIAPADDAAVLWSPEADPNAPGLTPDPRHAALGQRAWAPAVDLKPGAADYHRARVAAGIAEAGADFEPDSVFPHEANYDALAGVSFTKGCFIGQEVVSRMEHRGTARKRFLPCKIDGPLPERGAPVTSDARTVGQTGSAAGGHALALLRLDSTTEAIATGTPLLAGAARLTPRIPDWLDATVSAKAGAAT